MSSPTPLTAHTKFTPNLLVTPLILSKVAYNFIQTLLVLRSNLPATPPQVATNRTAASRVGLLGQWLPFYFQPMEAHYIGLGRIDVLCCHLSTLYQIH